MSLLAKVIIIILGYSIDQTFIESFSKQRIWIFPHTSKFEAFLAMLAVMAIQKEDSFSFPCSKDYIETPIIGDIIKFFGGFPVIKSRVVEGNLVKGDMVKRIVRFLKKNPNKQFPISPEGGLASREWKSGFFYIAKETGLPISVGGIDFVNHTIKANINEEIYINEDDRYEDRIQEIKDMFAKSKIYPLYEDCSNPIVINNTGYKSTLLPMSRKIILIAILFGISGYVIYKLI